MAGIKGITWAKNRKQSKEKLERLKLAEIWEIITDKRFGIRFRIANLICRDYTRNYMVSVNCRLNNCIEIIENPYYSDEVKLKHINRNIRRAKRTLDEVFEL